MFSNGELTPVVIALLVIVVLTGVATVGLVIAPYNAMIRLRNTIQESWRQVDVELNRRYELIPTLVEAVGGYASHERDTLERIVRLRAQSASLHAPTDQRAGIEQQLDAAVAGLLARVESYPELTSNQNFLELQKQLADTEDRIAAARRYYNANVRNYNTMLEQFPTNLVAAMAHFQQATYFELADADARLAPVVNFGELNSGDADRTSEQRPTLPGTENGQHD